jgi:D-methionine transport system substrate-binding protein
MKQLFHAICSFFFLSLFTLSCNNHSGSQLKVAATSVPHAEILEHIKPELKEKGINLNIVIVEDYNTPNRALQDKEVDANFFQHLPFLEAQSADFGYQLESLVGVHIEPMGLYSKKIKSLTELKLGMTIAIPNDPTNQARALLLLEQNGLIQLSKKDITANLLDAKDSAYKFIEIDPAMLSRSLEDVDMAAITTNFALQAGLNPQKDALAIEDGHSLFTNIVAIRKGDAAKPELQALKEALISPSTKQFISERYQGAIMPVS